MPYNNKIAGQIIGMLRCKRNLTQEELSGLAGIARSHLAMIETGKKSANVETLWRITQALGMRMSEFFHMIEEAEQEKA